MAGEAVTLQLGHYAGCVGAHWWGLQRRPPPCTELNHAALLRAGREGCTPRLIALELKGGVGPLGRGGVRPEPLAAWRGDVANYAEPGTGTEVRDRGQRPGDASADGDRSSSASVQDAAPGSSTQLWSDYLSVQLHPRSIYVLQQYNHDGDSGRLEAFGQGEKLLQDVGCVEELEDRLHFFVEECDYLQGFQVLCDLHDGFSGVGAKVTELLHDEYSRKGILTWGLTPVTHNVGDPQKNFYRVLNTALGIAHLSAHSSLFCPLSLSGSLGIKPQPPIAFPYLNYDASLNYHSSAVLAAALDTLTVPYRLCSSPGSMMHLAEMLNFSGRKVVAAWAAVPFPAVRGHSLPDALCAHQQELPWKLLSSCREQKVSRCFAQSVVLRGICKENPTSCPGQQPPSPLHACETAEQVLQCYLHAVFPGAFSASLVLEQPCVTLPPYPHIFSSLLSRQGFLPDDLSSYSAAAVESIPVLTSLQSSAALRTLLSDLCKDLQKLGTRRCASFFAAGVEEDDFHEAFEELRTLSQCYEMGFEAGNSEDESDSD
ncbi:protein misato homolog 1 isoform X1 [Tympanuchus pallidicinctus]|uniref:protein misato homolog 1 isoform X1 n=1 Tax=Tympanuchus pallidicinctus TaxID=109042 RepID=UPI0022872470|nr:protein misato homolog 1 isoform X1 [Tympanuchus pallidicinctus]